MGLVFNIQKYSVHDGPGIRTTVFLKGCPLACEWCHNPEGISPRPEMRVNGARCIRCGHCQEVCPEARGGGMHPVAPGEDCHVCGACAEACPTGARQMAGREMMVAEVMAEIGKDRIFYEESGGGVTFSGGEPLLQAEFLLALLAACRDRGIHTAVDTCGFVPRRDLLAAARMTDLFLYDLKFMDESRHRRHTGVSNAPILRNLQALGQAQADIWVRVPVIPDINDDEENMAASARFAAGIPGVRQVYLLPYHPTGTGKLASLGKTSALPHLVPPAPPRLEQIAGLFRAQGLVARVGG
jgi:pyruvate formate lyase activating enzyme